MSATDQDEYAGPANEGQKLPGQVVAEGWESLDGFLIGDEHDLPERLEDHATAERMLRSVAWRKRELAVLEDLAESQIEQTREWIALERKRLDTEYFERCLQGYMAALLEQHPNGPRSIKLPSGTLKARAGQPQWDIDPEAFLPWAQTYAESLIRTKPEPAVAEIKKAFKPDLERGVVVNQAGEIVPGIKVSPPVTTYKVEVGE